MVLRRFLTIYYSHNQYCFYIKIKYKTKIKTDIKSGLDVKTWNYYGDS